MVGALFFIFRGDDFMELTEEQKDMLNGKYGEGTAYGPMIWKRYLQQRKNIWTRNSRARLPTMEIS